MKALSCVSRQCFSLGLKIIIITINTGQLRKIEGAFIRMNTASDTVVTAELVQRLLNLNFGEFKGYTYWIEYCITQSCLKKKKKKKKKQKESMHLKWYYQMQRVHLV